MSYYQKSKFSVTTHALVRARQRLPNLGSKSDLFLEVYLLDLLNKIGTPTLKDNYYDYYHIYQYEKLSLYIVVERKNNLIITVTRINHEKQLKIFYR